MSRKALDYLDGGPILDYSHRSALEFISLQNRERTHAEVLRWLLSEHSRLGMSAAGILAGLLGDVAAVLMPEGSRVWSVEAVRTERTIGDCRLDLVALLASGPDRCGVVIELKLASVESPSQLARYDDVLDQALGLARGASAAGHFRVAKVLLSVAGDAPRSGHGWIARTYGDLRRALSHAVPPEGPNGDEARICLADYGQMLDRIEDCMTRARRGEAFAGALVIGQAEPGPDAATPGDLVRYVEEMSLGGLAQRAWLLELVTRARALEPAIISWEVHVGERIKTGGALLNVHLAELATPDGTRFRHGVQFQGGIFKAYIEPLLDRPLTVGEALQARPIHAQLLAIKQEKPYRWTRGKKTLIAEGEAGHRSLSLRDGVLPVGDRGRRGALSLDEWAQALATAVQFTVEDVHGKRFPGIHWHPVAPDAVG